MAPVMALSPLHIRRPVTTWMIAAAFFALCLHGLCTFVIQLLTGNADAAGEAQRQMVLAIAWMTGSLILWRLRPPASRLHALLTAMACAVFVAFAGTVVRFITVLIGGAAISKQLLLSYSLLSAVVFIGYFVAAVLSSLLLQGIALTRPKADAPGTV